MISGPSPVPTSPVPRALPKDSPQKGTLLEGALQEGTLEKGTLLEDSLQEAERQSNQRIAKDASAGKRTRVTSMATMYSATRPLMHENARPELQYVANKNYEIMVYNLSYYFCLSRGDQCV